MKTKTLHQSSWGRILLMLRADLVTHKTSLIVVFVAFIGLAFFFPRLPILAGVTYQEWIETWIYSYDPHIVNAIMSVTSTLYFFIYVNRRIVHSSPCLFSTLPASLGEKVISILLFGAIIHVLSIATTLVSQAIEFLTVPNIQENFKTMWHGVYDILADWDTPLSVLFTASGYTLGTLLITFWSCISVRNAFLALVLSWLIQTGITIVYISLTTNILLTSNANDGALVIGFFAWIISLVFLFLNYKKLRSIAS